MKNILLFLFEKSGVDWLVKSAAIYYWLVEMLWILSMEAGYIPVGATGGSVGNAVPPVSVAAPQAKVVRAPGLKRGKLEEAISDRVSKCFSFQ